MAKLLVLVDIYKRDLKALGMDLHRWETLTSECSAWRQAVHHDHSQFEEALVQQAKAKRQSRKQPNQGAGQGTDSICLQGGRDGHSQIGLLSHTRHCFKSSFQSTLASSLETQGCLHVKIDCANKSRQFGESSHLPCGNEKRMASSSQ